MLATSWDANTISAVAGAVAALAAMIAVFQAARSSRASMLDRALAKRDFYYSTYVVNPLTGALRGFESSVLKTLRDYSELFSLPLEDSQDSIQQGVFARIREEMFFLYEEARTCAAATESTGLYDEIRNVLEWLDDKILTSLAARPPNLDREIVQHTRTAAVRCMSVFRKHDPVLSASPDQKHSQK